MKQALKRKHRITTRRGRTAAMLASLAIAACSKNSPSPAPDAGIVADSGDKADAAQSWTFPAGFLFGTAIAGFQADMGCPTLPPATCDDANSDWYAFTTDPAMQTDPTAHLSGQNPSVVGPGFWELFDQDLVHASEQLKNNAFRMSIEWSRVFPKATDGATTQDELRALADSAALARYHAMFASMRAHGLKPLVTLNHYSLPTWIHDAVACHKSFATCTNKGWVDRERIVREIAKYAGFVAAEFGGEIDLWATLNEPMAVIFPGYLAPGDFRSNPPAVGLQGAAARTAMAAMVEAHARMYDAVKKYDTRAADGTSPPAMVGVVFNVTPMAPNDPANPVESRPRTTSSIFGTSRFSMASAKGTSTRISTAPPCIATTSPARAITLASTSTTSGASRAWPVQSWETFR